MSRAISDILDFCLCIIFLSFLSLQPNIFIMMMVSYRDEELQGPIDSQAPAKKNKTIPMIIFSLAILSVVALLTSDVESLSFSSDSRRMLEADPKPTDEVRRGTQAREAANKPEADPKPTGEVRRLKKAVPPPSSSVSSAKPAADSKDLEGSPVMHTFFEDTDKPCCGMSSEGHLERQRMDHQGAHKGGCNETPGVRIFEPKTQCLKC